MPGNIHRRDGREHCRSHSRHLLRQRELILIVSMRFCKNMVSCDEIFLTVGVVLECRDGFLRRQVLSLGISTDLSGPLSE